MTSPNSIEQAVVKDEKPSQGEEKKTKAKKEKKPPKVKESAAGICLLTFFLEINIEINFFLLNKLVIAKLQHQIH